MNYIKKTKFDIFLSALDYVFLQRSGTSSSGIQLKVGGSFQLAILKNSKFSYSSNWFLKQFFSIKFGEKRLNMMKDDKFNRWNKDFEYFNEYFGISILGFKGSFKRFLRQSKRFKISKGQPFEKLWIFQISRASPNKCRVKFCRILFWK